MIHLPDSESKEDSSDRHDGENPTQGTKMTPAALTLVQRLRAQGLEVIDKRPSGGALWVVGGQDIKQLIRKFEGNEISFTFAPGGGQVTNKRSAWWTRSTA